MKVSYLHSSKLYVLCINSREQLIANNLGPGRMAKVFVAAATALGLVAKTQWRTCGSVRWDHQENMQAIEIYWNSTVCRALCADNKVLTRITATFSRIPMQIAKICGSIVGNYQQILEQINCSNGNSIYSIRPRKATEFLLISYKLIAAMKMQNLHNTICHAALCQAMLICFVADLNSVPIGSKQFPLKISSISRLN